MPNTDPRVDAYIRNSAPFARPILKHLRKLIHAACPGVEEALKWGMPAFSHHGLLCGFAAFKAHCTFGFWKGDLLFADDPAAQKRADAAMGHWGRISSPTDLPADKVLATWIKRAMRLNQLGIKRLLARRANSPPRLVIPSSLRRALQAHPKARATFDAFSYSHRKEYCEWIGEAKQEKTKARRLATAIEWLNAGKSRNWRYERPNHQKPRSRKS